MVPSQSLKKGAWKYDFDFLSLLDCPYMEGKVKVASGRLVADTSPQNKGPINNRKNTVKHQARNLY